MDVHTARNVFISIVFTVIVCIYRVLYSTTIFINSLSIYEVSLKFVDCDSRGSSRSSPEIPELYISNMHCDRFSVKINTLRHRAFDSDFPVAFAFVSNELFIYLFIYGQ